MTPNLARYIRIARHHIHGTPLDEESRIEQQKISAIEDLQTYVVRKIDPSVRGELLAPAKWYWDDAIGASVQFSIDGPHYPDRSPGYLRECNITRLFLCGLAYDF